MTNENIMPPDRGKLLKYSMTFSLIEDLKREFLPIHVAVTEGGAKKMYLQQEVEIKGRK